MQDPIVIVAAKRTPIGNFMGSLSPVSATSLGSSAIAAAIKQCGVDNNDINEVYMGCVLPAGLGQAPARQAALGAGLPYHAGATTVNKMCGSGMKAVMLAHDYLIDNDMDILVAGGMESMSNAPYLLPKARGGMRMGHSQCIDHMFFDGLEDAYDTGKLMGCFAEETATKYHFTREQQDAFAIQSLQRAKKAATDGSFDDEIVSVKVQNRKETITVSSDDGPNSVNEEKITQLKPAFASNGTVTAANASSISDGAAALVLMRRSHAVKRGIKPLATIVAHASHAQEPAWFTTAPVGAISRVLEKARWNSQQVDLYEVNEAFAVVTMAAMHELHLPAEKVNVNGGACTLGHPIGASGARILVTLIHALHKNKKSRGIAALCIGGGEATAVALQVEQ